MKKYLIYVLSSLILFSLIGCRGEEKTLTSLFNTNSQQEAIKLLGSYYEEDYGVITYTDYEIDGICFDAIVLAGDAVSWDVNGIRCSVRSKDSKQAIELREEWLAKLTELYGDYQDKNEYDEYIWYPKGNKKGKIMIVLGNYEDAAGKYRTVIYRGFIE